MKQDEKKQGDTKRVGIWLRVSTEDQVRGRVLRRMKDERDSTPKRKAEMWLRCIDSMQFPVRR